jgi:Histidine kinase-, DNA gyrase B-, and HSP90-like ATPase
MVDHVDFLTPGASQIRHQILNIIDSYNNEWDILAELTQNSVDAIKQAKPIKGHIVINIDACEKTITLSDNGIGIDPNRMPELLRPFSSDKRGETDLIGNKGVGISFVIFSSIEFEIESHHSNGSSWAKIEGARSWVDSKNSELPKLSIDKIQPSGETGTTVKIHLPQDSGYEFFNYTFRQLDMILRTRTALGDTNTIWGQKSNKDFVLSFKDLNGNVHTEEIECEYFLPISKLGKSAHISLRDFQEWNTGERTDAQKRVKLRDKVVYHDGYVDKNGRRIRYWYCFVPKRKAWDIISVNSELVEKDILELVPRERIVEYGDLDYLFSGGMYTATRGMPTGIRSEMKAKGSAGYLPNFFIILDDPQLSFDIGRKSIPGRQMGMLRELGSDAFRDCLNVIKKYMSGEPEAIDEPWERGKIFAEIRKLPILSSKSTLFQRRPYSQEASVAAIFFEMIGNKIIGGFRPYISGYRNKYDLYASYMDSDVVVEFKHSLSGLFRDFDDEAKLFDQINIVVVWDVTENDREIVASRGLDLQDIEYGLTKPTENSPFHFNLVLGPTQPIRIICVKRLIDGA